MARRQSKKDADTTPADAREQVTIRHAIFSYEDAEGIPRRARRGAVIEVGQYDLERGKAGGAFVEHHDTPTPDLTGPAYGTEAAPPPPLAQTTDDDALNEYGDDALAQWVASQSPEDIAEAMVTARDAQRVIMAENATTNNDPRTSLVSLMEAVIASTEAAAGNNPDEEPEDLSNTPDPGPDES